MSRNENQKREEFEFLWRDRFSLVPPLDTMPREQYEQLKEFAWEVYREGFSPSPKRLW